MNNINSNKAAFALIAFAVVLSAIVGISGTFSQSERGVETRSEPISANAQHGERAVDYLRIINDSLPDR
ncbi:MAG: hypothetical protein FWD35_05955, partial [Oscillospiraceae bacterium]|nr:hypothetical protein [Oscillospiraceae bacterium]